MTGKSADLNSLLFREKTSKDKKGKNLDLTKLRTTSEAVLPILLYIALNAR